VHTDRAVQERNLHEPGRVQAHEDDDHPPDPADVSLRDLDSAQDLPNGDPDDREDGREAEDKRHGVQEYPASWRRPFRRDGDAREMTEIAGDQGQAAG